MTRRCPYHEGELVEQPYGWRCAFCDYVEYKRGGTRPGAGRPYNDIPSHRIVVHATDDEMAQIMALSPRERTERMTMARYEVTYRTKDGKDHIKVVDARNEFEAKQLAGAFNEYVISIINLDR